MARVFLTEDPYLPTYRGRFFLEAGQWPCRWISCPDAPPAPFVSAYRRKFSLASPATVRIHLTADERYELFLDGTRIGRGSERGDLAHWYFETYDLSLDAGEHLLVARVWSMGDQAAFAQMSLKPGFLCSPQDPEHLPLLGTGVAEWEAKLLGGYQFTDPHPVWGTGANLAVEGKAFSWGFERGEGEGWRPAAAGPFAFGWPIFDGKPSWVLRPAVLPPMLEETRQVGRVRLVSNLEKLTTRAIPIRAADDLPEERAAWQELIDGRCPLTVPPHTLRRVLLDLDQYYCAYPEVQVSGGAGSTIRVHWQEGLYQDMQTWDKGNRDEIEGKFFASFTSPVEGVGDTFKPAGGGHRRFDTLWWQCGRFVEIVVETGAAPLEIESFLLRETRYPLENTSRFEASDPRLADAVPLMVRALQMCSHETYMDCPFYEQLMYIGDTRLEALVTHAITPDARLPLKALQMFDASRQPNGLTMSRYPCHTRQIIPPFSLWYVCMLEDHALWRGDRAQVEALLPGVRGVVDYFASRRNAEGLVQAPEGWNFLDWTLWPPGTPEAGKRWTWGCPPDAQEGVSCAHNWQCVLTFDAAARLEAWCGEPELAARNRRLAEELAGRVVSAFWDVPRGLFADDLFHTYFSEHAQCLSLLTGRVDPARAALALHGLMHQPNLALATIYFSHYVLEAFYAHGRGAELLSRLEPWFELSKNGLRTTIEHPEPSRSDCHAWGAHPLYHYFASILGIRPSEHGFASVRIAPQLGNLEWARGTMPHPKGEIAVDLRQENGAVRGTVTLPSGVNGVFVHGRLRVPLTSGAQTIP